MRDTTVLLWQKFHREMDAFQIPARNGKITRLFRAARQDHGIIRRLELLERFIDTDMHIVMEHDAFGFQLRDATVDEVLFHFKVWNTIA